MGFFSQLKSTLDTNQTTGKSSGGSLFSNISDATSNISSAKSWIDSKATNSNWYKGDQPTYGEALARAYKIAEDDYDTGLKLVEDLHYLRNDSSSMFYNQYASYTNPAVDELKALGVDVSTLSADLFKTPEMINFMETYLERSSTADSAKAPTKKSSLNNRKAYWLNQWYTSEADTQSAEKDYQNLISDAMYLAGNPGWNYSDDEIINMLIGKDGENLKGKYSSLYDMYYKPEDEDKDYVAKKLNRALDYSEDALRGMMWLARNPDEKVNSIEQAMVYSYMGKGKAWEENKTVSALLNPEDSSYLPYAVGSTNLLNEGQTLGMYYFPEEWFDGKEFSNLYYNGTPEQKAAAAKVLDAEMEWTRPAEKASETIYNYAEYLLEKDHDANSVREKLDAVLTTGKLYVGTDKDGKTKYYTKAGKGREEIDLSVLNKIDKTVGKTDINGNRSFPVNDPDELLSFTRPINYKYDNLISAVNTYCDEYNKLTSGDTYANLDPNNVQGNREKKSFELIEEGMSKRTADAAFILDDKLSENERKNFNALPMGNGTKLAEAFYNVKRGLWGNGEEIVGPYDMGKLTDPEWIEKMATKQAATAEENYKNVNLGSLQIRTEYEDKQKEADGLQAQLDEIYNQYGDIMLAKEEIPELLKVTIDEDTGFTVNLRLEKDKDGNEVYKYHQKDNTDLSDSLPAQDYMSQKGLTEADIYAAINEKAKQHNENIKLIKDAKGRVLGSSNGLTLDEMKGPDEGEINRISAQLDQLRGQLNAAQPEYEKAVEELKNASDRRTRSNDLALRNSGMYVDPAVTDRVVSFVAGFTNYQKPQAGYDSLIDDLRAIYGFDGLAGEQEKKYKDDVDELKEYAKDIRYMIDNYNLPDFYKKKMTEAAEYVEARARQYDAYLITNEKDFDSLIKDALDENNELSYDGPAEPYKAGIIKAAWDQMNSIERNVYYALYKKQGLEAASQFYQDIEENLITRAQTNIREGAKETAESGFLGRVFNEAVSIGMAALEVPLNIAYLVDSAVNGEGSGWWRIPSEAAQEANNAVISELKDIYKGTIWGDVLPGIAEIINNRGRSMVVAATLGKLIPVQNEVVQSFPIATIAFGEAYQEAIENGMEPWQAWALGAINFACESVTEGIKFGNYQSLLDGNVTLQTFADYFYDKFAGLDWLEEATGETLNNILERAFNKWIGGDKSDHARRIQEYIDSGLVSSVDEAEIMLAADYVKEDMHTAIISALSSFMDIGMFGAGKLMDTAHYAKEVVKARANGDTTTTIRSLRNNDVQMIKMVRDYQKIAEKNRQQMVENAKQPYALTNPSDVSETQQQRNQTEYDVDLTILENSADSEQTAVTGTIAAVLRVSTQNANRANAAAVSFVQQFGENAVGTLQDMLEAGRKSGTNINTLKLGIQYSLLADGECRRIMSTEEYQNATPEQQARMLSAATQIDANSQTVQDTVNEAVHDNRVAEAEKDLMAEKARDLKKLEDKAKNAATDVYIAKQEMEDRQKAQEQAGKTVTTLRDQFLANPTAENERMLDRAVQEWRAAGEVAKEYEQSYQNALQKQQEAEAEFDRAKDDNMAQIRQGAEQRVAGLEQQEAKAEQEANEALKAAEQERLRLQAEEDARTGKDKEDADLAKIDEYIKRMNLSPERAANLRKQAEQFYHGVVTGDVDTTKLLSDSEADMAIYKLGRRLGIAIEVDKKGDPNELPEGRDGKYSNGKIILSRKLTVGQAMVQVALHEITHSLEKTKSYGKYKDTVFSILFNSPDQREAEIEKKLKFYQTRGVKNFTREDAEHEIVADFAANDKTFANRQTIDRMLDEGLGSTIRNALHNINQYLKNAKLEGKERERAENLRKAERLYIKAMNERRSINTHPSSEQFSVNQFAAAAGLFYNEVNITDDLGNVIAGPGLYTADPSIPENNAVKIDKVTPEMMENTPVGLLTNAAQALGTMNRETAGKIHTMFADLMTMCTNLQDTNLVWEIAGSTLYSEFSAIKANSDKQYSTTVDFGTICTKTQAVINQLSRDMLRLGRGLTSQEILEVYNDVYNADLKVPCPVCYVFSRWLGVPSLLENIRQYQNRFLGDEGAEVDASETQKRVNEFIAKAHQEYGIDKDFDENLKKARDKALAKVEKIKNGKDGIAETEAKIARLNDQLKTKQRKDWQNQLASAEKKLAQLQDDLKQAQADYDNAEINAYSKAINKKKADIESSIKYKLIKIEGDDRGKRGINDDIRDAIKEGKPTDKLEAQREKVYAEIDKLNEQLREVDAYNWVTQALCTMDREGNFVIDPEFKRTKNEILLDLNRTGEFAKDTKNWTYRSTRGAGMGKAILPYSGATIGDSVLGIGARTMANPYEDGDSEGAFSALKSAIAKAKRQNLIGGQRFQSTSDFRPEWGLDYIMTFIEQQAIGSNGQLYTKVKEFAPLAASVGVDTNCSIMPYANGWHDPADGEIEAMTESERKSRVVTFKDENGNERTVILDFSDVTGMEYAAARELSKSFDSVQMIMVGINDIHIRACLAGEEIDFVIPWHASGNTKSQLQNMMATVNETLTNSSDYTKVQTDQIANKEGLKEAHDKLERGETLTATEADLIHKEQMRDARMRLLTGATLTATDMERIAESTFLTSLYERFEGKTLDGKELPHDSAYWIELPGNDGEVESERVTMTTGQAEQIFPYEYWDTSLTKDQADENGWRFVQYCQELGLTPRFSGGNQTNEDKTVTRFGNFSGAVYDADGNIIGYDREQMAKGYWKTLIDRKMYDNNGNYRSQQQIDASKVQAGSLMQGENGLVHTQSNIPDSISGAKYRGAEAEAKYRQADKALKDRLTEKAKLNTKEGEQARIDLANLNAWETAHANDHEQYRVTPEINPYEEMTAGEMMQLLSDAGVDYQNAVQRGDTSTALSAISFQKGIKEVPHSNDILDNNMRQLASEDEHVHITGTMFSMDTGTLVNDVSAYYDSLADQINSEMFGKVEITRRKVKDSLGHGMTPLKAVLYESVPEIIRTGKLIDYNTNWKNQGYDAAILARSVTIDDGPMKGDYYAGVIVNRYGDGRNAYYTHDGVAAIINRSDGTVITTGPIGSDRGSTNRFLTDILQQVADYNGESGNSESINQEYRDESSSNEEQWSINDNSSTEMTPAEMLQLLKDAGVYQQEEAPTDYEATGPQRQFGSETVQNAEGVSQTVKNWLKTHSDYNPDTNDEQVNRAVKWIIDKRSDIDPEGFWSALEEVESKDFNPLTADGQAKMYVLMSMAANKGRNGDINVQLRLADAINKQGTTLGQALQARRLFRLMTPEGRLSVLQKEVDRVNSELKSKGKEGNVILSDWILRAAAAAQTEEEFAKAREAMWKELGEKMPVNYWDRIQAWRMVSMLGNPRTHLRNIVGNLGFVPAVMTKNKIGAVLENIFVPEGERTKALWANKDSLDYAEADAEKVKTKLTGEGKYTDATQIQRNKKPFGKTFAGKLVQGVADYSGNKLEQEDWIFLNYHYKHALAGWMTANKVTGDQLDNDSALLDKARAYAIEEAQKATYRDANALAEWLSKGDRIPGVRLLTTSILPFKKTPMNILERGLEYSPLGFLKNITADVVRLAEYQKWANGKKAEKADWALSPSQFIDKLSSGITGLGIAGIGAFMKSMGWLTLGFKKEEPEDEFKKARGEQEYALKIELFGHDITYTIDWAAPACMSIFVGAAMQEAAEKGGVDLGETLMGLGSVTEPIWNLSMMDGLNSLFETSQYEDGNVATQIIMKVGLNFANSFIPTLVGQLSRTIDTARRKSYVQSGSKPSAAYYTFEQMQNKTPWSVYNIPYRDVRGNEDRKPWAQRLIENFISPGYFNSSEKDSTIDELERLYLNNQEDKNVGVVVPQNADKSFTVKGETVKLTDQQYDQMDVERKQLAFGLLDKLIADPYYAKVDDAARIDMINDIWTYATQQAKYNQFPQVSREDWITRAQKNNIDMLDVIKKRSESQIKQDSIDGWSDALVNSIKAGNQDDVELAVGTLELHDLDEDDINKIVKNGFSKAYVKAYKDDDEDTMYAIEGMLYDAGFNFDYEDWLKTTVNNEEKWLQDYNP